MPRFLPILAALSLASGVFAQPERKQKKPKKEEKEPVTQTLPALPDPPSAILASTSSLVFRVSPLSSKGLMTPQTREALRALLQDHRGTTIVKLRAFVTGSGDMRRIATLVSETFTERKLPLPVVSTIQVGGLPMEGAQIVIESVALDKKAVNPHGMAFFSGQQTKDLRQSLAHLQTAVSGAKVAAGSVLRATCFLSSLDHAAEARTAILTAFPNAAANVVQLQRLAVEPLAECEAVGRLDAPPGSPVVLLNPPELTQSPNYSQVALVNSPRIVITGTQQTFGNQDADFRLAFGRLQKALEPFGAGFKDVFWSSAYPLSRTALDKLRAIRWDYYDKSRPSASTAVLFEGLPSLDATLALEVIAVAR